ncbi:MAG: DUF2680 domain-containing protein [Verrucomicrobia bacterium]|nr:DUF2680 domain-containing protein [Verrucomicrobiota bacterium]
MNSMPPDPANGEPAPASTSLISRLFNIFVYPGEVFDEVRSTPHRVANWLVPMVLACFVGVAFVVTTLSMEALVHQVQELQEKAFQRKIDAGKIPKEQAAQVKAAMDRFMTPTVMMVGGSVIAVGAAVAWPFLAALIVWLLGKVAFKASFSYLKALEVCGLTGMIDALNQVVRLLLALGLGSIFVTPGPVLLVRDFDAQNLWHLQAAAFSVLTIWQVGVISLGLARLSGSSWAKAASWLYGLWAAVVFGFTWVSWAISRL